MSLSRYEKLLDDLNATFRPQREWIEGRGLLLVIAHFFTGIGAGTWLFSLFFQFGGGLTVSFVLTAVGGVAHLFFLGRWERFWRMLARSQTSWISRGFIGINLFLLSALLYLAPSYIPSLPWGPHTAAGQVLLALTLVGIAAILVYKGFVFAVTKAIPFWNTPILPFLYIVYSLRGGAAVLLLSAFIGVEGLEIGFLKLVELWVILTTGVLILFYLAVMREAGVAARRSVADLIAGRVFIPFYLGTIFFGLVVPITVGAIGYGEPLSLSLLGLVAASSLIGDFYIKYCVNKAGIYIPIVSQFAGRA